MSAATHPNQAMGAAMIAKAIAGATAAGQSDLEEGDNLGTAGTNETRVGSVAADRLRSIVERIERLEEERTSIGADIKDVFGEAKSAGFDVIALRALLALRKKEPAVVEEQETLFDLYRRALGMSL